MNVIRVGVCFLLGFQVLALGGALSWAETILHIGAAGLFLTWAIIALRNRRANIHWNWLYMPLIGLFFFALIQYVFGITVFAYLTKIELLKLCSYILLFFLTFESFRSIHEANYFAWFLVLVGFFVSLFGIVQHFTFNGKLYWSIPLLQGGIPFGPYVDRDHFAGFVELTAPMGIALLSFHAWHREKLTLLILFTIVPIGALILCASRGGIIALFFEAVVLVMLSRVHQFGRMQLVTAISFVLLAGTFIVWLGVSDAIQRFQHLTVGEISRDRRVSMYRDTWHVFTHHAWFGTGLGTLAVVYPRYESFYDAMTVDHAHNDFLELLSDTGVIGGICGFGFTVLLFLIGITRLQTSQRRLTRAIHAGALAACAGLLLHSLVDFNLHIPSNALIFLSLAAIATTELSELSDAGLRRETALYAWNVPAP
jgi:hypothetical protein